MGSSTTTVQEVIDTVSTMADVSPQANPSGYDATITLAIANDVMNDLIARRFNWKWNSFNAAPFLTNSWQQDYPGIGLGNVGWIEEGLWVDINSTTLPKPNDRIEARKDLSPARTRTSSLSYPTQVCWMYNRQLQYGRWPGATAVYRPLIGTQTAQNPPTAILDTNGNILTLTTFGTTGTTSPAAPAGSAEGTTVDDGTCVWTVCDPGGKGFRIDVLAPPSGPVYQILTKCQASAGKIVSLQATLDPIPDDYAHHFRRGYKAGCYGYSSDAKTRAQYPAMRAEWLASMVEAEEQGDREPDAYGLYPATSVVTPLWGLCRNPNDPGRPV